MGTDAVDTITYLLANALLQVEVFLHVLLVQLCDAVLVASNLRQLLGQTGIHKVAMCLDVGQQLLFVGGERGLFFDGFHHVYIFIYDSGESEWRFF